MLTVIKKGLKWFGLSDLDGGIYWWVVSGVIDVIDVQDGQRLAEAIVEQLYTASGGTVPFAAWYEGVGRPYREAPYCKVWGNKAIIKQWFGWDC